MRSASSPTRSKSVLAFHCRHQGPQVGGGRLSAGDDLHALVVDLQLELVHALVGDPHQTGQLGVMGDKGMAGAAHLLFNDAAHLH